MTEPKWTTPGPWHVCIDDTGGPFSGWPSVDASPDLDMTIVHRAGFKQEFWGDTTERIALANARLIAASPDLYAALDFIFDHIADISLRPRDLYPAFGLNASRAVEMARTALARARGETP